MHYSSNRLKAGILILTAAIALTAMPLRATALQSTNTASRFTVDDLLDVANINASDLSDDGRWLAAISGTLRDRIGIDNHRFGDPTYVAPNNVDVWIIDTQAAKAQKLFPTKRQVRGLKWSPDATRLALFVLKGDSFEPQIWERASGKFTEVKLPASKICADNAEFEWSPDGSQLFFALRQSEWKKKAAERFAYETNAPVVVHSSKEPFLAWDDLRRMSAIRSLVAYDVKSGQTREVVPEMKLGSYDLSEDGSFINYQEDITKKTDYDVIFGAENKIQTIPAAGGQPRTLIKSTKGLTITWSRDGRRYAYAKDGNLFVGSIDDKDARQLTGRKDEKEKTDAADKP